MLITSENSRVKDRYDHQFKFFIEFFEEILGKCITQEASLYYLGIIKFAQLLLLDNKLSPF